MAHKTDAEPIEAQIVTTTPSVPRAVMVSPATLRKQMQRDQDMRAVIEEYIKNNMIAGKDYGSIEVKKGTGIMSKPSLLKPGGEKFCGLFKIRPTFRKDFDTVEMLGNTPGIIAYICELVDTSGNVIGEGRGTARTDPKNSSDFEINKQIKIAQKRAQIDAVLRTGGLSDFFTQDMEDASDEPTTPRANAATDKQIKTIYDCVVRLTGFESQDDMDEWLQKAVGATPSQLTTKSAGAVISKLFDAEKRLKEEAVQPENPDTVITDIPDNITLDDIGVY